ncbi:MAG TPA: L-seryl-tRNA(Sec) selenium transferase [Chthoniobacterales bacterium]|nr:L-seryl-tRNA(Sec) selenium transferase [Chthoniobacterales bacterium]
MKTPRRAIPAVGRILEALGNLNLPRPLVIQLVRQHLTSLRGSEVVPPFDQIVFDLRRAIVRLEGSRLQPLINGTGVVIHTNFGRAPLGAAAMRALAEIGSSYNNLEYDLTTGARGKRAGYLEMGLALLCGSEAATVVNNCAAALVLIVRHFTRKKPEVIISRGELVQIGGGFRIGEILEASGARLREVGATNKTDLRDYEKAIGPATAMILKVHQSNFFISGFAGSPPNDEIAKVARTKRIPFVEDLGSGAICATEALGLAEHEPTPNESLKRGADLVCFSGDKLLGGPQAGIIAGKARLIMALKREPLFRALRCDKLALAALAATVDAHLRNDQSQIPILAILQISIGELRKRGEKILASLEGFASGIRLVESKARIGGGALPRSIIPSLAIEFTLNEPAPNELAIRLRNATPPVIGYVARGKFHLDLRTVFPDQDEQLASAVRACLTTTT